MSALPRKVVLASSNSGKLREIERILAEFDIEIVSQSEFGVTDAEETGATFIENALIKARHAVAATGLPAIADDSGIVVDALDGRPGVYSARYAGPGASDEDNNRRLLAELDGVPDEQRGAAFHCVACLVMTDEEGQAGAGPGGENTVIAAGEWRGRILHEPRGEGGFGYDPLFFVPELGRSSAELSAEEKNARSHRGKALRNLARQLRAH